MGEFLSNMPIEGVQVFHPDLSRTMLSKLPRHRLTGGEAATHGTFARVLCIALSANLANPLYAAQTIFSKPLRIDGVGLELGPS